jgi:hypothetical protein
VGCISDQHDAPLRPAREGDLLNRRDADVRCSVEQRGGGIRELCEQLAEPLSRAALGCVVVWG